MNDRLCLGALLAVVLLAAGCGGGDGTVSMDGGRGDNGTSCSTGLRDGTVAITLSGGETASESFTIVCGINPESPWQASSVVVPSGLGVDPYVELRIVNGSDWGLSMRFDTDALVGTADALVPDAVPPPIGHGWFATPVDTNGYQWALSTGTITISAIDNPQASVPNIRLLTGTASVTFTGPTTINATVTFTDYPVTVPAVP